MQSSTIVFLGFIIFLIAYVAYKVSVKKDFGVGIRRHLGGFVVVEDAVALVPFWWFDWQTQRALKNYWHTRLQTEAKNLRWKDESKTNLQESL